MLYDKNKQNLPGNHSLEEDLRDKICLETLQSSAIFVPSFACDKNLWSEAVIGRAVERKLTGVQDLLYLPRSVG